jgi:diguanylate cyclase (GGDEF)-like protein/PAS domain S-box-containing protein
MRFSYRLKRVLRWVFLLILVGALFGILSVLQEDPLAQSLLPTKTLIEPIFDKNQPVVVVGIDNAYPPYEFLVDGEPAGFNVDLIRTVGYLMGFNVEIQAAPWEEIRTALEEGEIDALAGMYSSSQRDQLVDFSAPHSLVKSSIFVRKDSPIRSLNDLKGRYVLVQQGDIMHDYLLISDLALNIIPVTSPEDALQRLAEGKYDAALLSSQYQGMYLIDKYHLSNLRQIDTGLEPQSYCFAVQDGNAALLLKLNEGLSIVQASGNYREIYRHWFARYERKAMVETLRPYLVILGVVLVALALALLWTWSLSEEVKLQTQRLSKSEERYRRLVELSPEAVFVLIERKIAYLNPAGEALFGIADSSAMIGKPVIDFMVLPDEGRNSQLMKLSGDQRFTRPNGSEFDASVSTASVDYLGDPAELWIVRDITEDKRNEARLRYAATHDLMTDLPNRSLFNDQISQALQRAARNHSHLAVLFLDMDDFKAVNDAFSHRSGDLLLRNIAKRLRNHVRSTDMVARLGGDEFAILCEDLDDPEDAAAVAQKILEGMKSPFYLEGQQIFCTFSLGIAMYPENGALPDSLLQNADIAMYRAKYGGKNTYQFFSPEMAVRVRQRLERVSLLRQAMEQDRLCLYYQPQVDTSTSRTTGAEALLRWRSETEGVLPAGEFIALAEESGLILSLGEWILRSACAEAQKWRTLGLPPMCVAVNLSSRQLEQPGLINLIQQVLQDTGLPPQCLELELTESTVIQNVKRTENTLKALRQMGVRLALDDFGTGYSSLSYVTSLPFDTIKIDRSFIKKVLVNNDDAVVVTGMITIARDLNKKVVIEGIENEAHLAFFQDRGAHLFQGYHFSPAIPADDLLDFLQNS